MQPRFLEKRVEILEHTVEGLAELPARVEAVEGRLAAVEDQVLQLRGEMRGEFSAVRQELRDGDEETRRQSRVLHEESKGHIQLIAEGHALTQAKVDGLRDEMNSRFTKVDAQFDRVYARFARMDLRFDKMDARLASLAKTLKIVVGRLPPRRRAKKK